MPPLNSLRKNKAANHHQKVLIQILERQYTLIHEVESKETHMQNDMLLSTQEIVLTQPIEEAKKPTKSINRDASRAKNPLGKTWAQRAGDNYKYFMAL